MNDVDASKQAAPTDGQRAAAWALGAIGLCGAIGVGLILGLTRNGALAPGVGMLALPTVFVALLWLTVWMAGPGAPLGAMTSRKVAWALLGAGFAAALGGLGWAFTDETGLVLVWGGVPFVLVAGTAARLAGPAGGGRGAGRARRDGPRPSSRGPARRSCRSGSRTRRRRCTATRCTSSASPATARPRPCTAATSAPARSCPRTPAIPQQRWISVLEYAREYATKDPGPCGETARDSDLQIAECTVEPDGWIYRRGVVHHGYQVIVGQSIVVVAGPLVVDQKVLRAAAAKVRLATTAELDALGFPGEELFTAEAPGYVAHARGIPHGSPSSRPTRPRRRRAC